MILEKRQRSPLLPNSNHVQLFMGSGNNSDRKNIRLRSGTVEKNLFFNLTARPEPAAGFGRSSRSPAGSR
ncbi:hypothetical protein JOC55_002733 [Paenibacillus sacheonensis]|nr:hypothetical protein [Paenibacillus sacheonensis]